MMLETNVNLHPAFHRGWQDCCSGIDLESNPYDVFNENENFRTWIHGYFAYEDFLSAVEHFGRAS